LAPDPDALGPTPDDLLALADAVREAARPVPKDEGAVVEGVRPLGVAPGTGRELGRRGHLRALPTPES